MTTDYTSVLINKDIKTTAAQGRKFQATDNNVSSGAFDSVFENVTKSYTDKSELNNLKNTTQHYAEKTKNLNTPTKTKANKVIKKSAQQVTNNNFEKNQNIVNKETSGSVLNAKKQTAANQNSATKTITQSEQSVSEPLKENFSENVSDTNNEISNTIPDSEKQITTDRDIAKDVTNELTQTEKIQDAFAEPNKNTVLEETAVEIDENSDNELTGQISTETLLANIDYNAISESFVQNIQNLFTNTTDIPETTVSENLAPLQTITEETQNQSYASTLQQTVLTNETKNTVLEQISQELIQSFGSLESVLQNDTNIQKVATQLDEELQKNVSDAQQNIQQKELSAPTTQTTEDISIEVVSDKIEIPQQETQTAQRTATQNLAADTTRFTVNIEEANVAENKVLTPEQTNSQITENSEIPMVQVTDEVAQSLKNFTEKIENKDVSSNVKDKVVEKLGKLLGADAVVTDVRNSKIALQSEFNSNSQGNTSLAQGNAAEQAIKMSIENVSEQETSADNFISQLEAKLNATSKTVNLKPATNFNLNKADILSQMNAKFNEMQQAGQNKVSIILRPENLGRVSVEIMNSKEGIIAKMTTDNQQVRELLDKNIEALKASLSSQGVNVNNIKVECTKQAENDSMNFERHQFEDNSQNFQGGNKENNQTNKNTEKAFWDKLSSTQNAEETEEPSETNRIQTTETTKTIITNNGKIDYKV